MTGQFEKTCVIDAGGRYGIHPSWKLFSGELQYFLFEPEPKERKRLQQKYRNRSDEVFIVEDALDEADGSIELNLSRNLAMSSSSKRLTVSPLFRGERKNQLDIVERLTVKSRSIDSFCQEMNLQTDFLKLDTEGSEFEILNGASAQLKNFVLGVRVEVAFDYIFEGKKLFSSINDLLLDSGFFLLNLDYKGRGDHQNEFANTEFGYGILTNTDAVFLRRNSRSFTAESYCDGKLKALEIFKKAAFCFMNSAADVAIEILLDGVRSKSTNYLEIEHTRLFMFVDKCLHRHFYSLKWQPGQSLEKHQDCYRLIFSKEMKVVNEYMESIDLNPD